MKPLAKFGRCGKCRPVDGASVSNAIEKLGKMV
jgi:hypothetical protein